jgi:hypothetical protein
MTRSPTAASDGSRRFVGRDEVAMDDPEGTREGSTGGPDEACEVGRLGKMAETGEGAALP